MLPYIVTTETYWPPEMLAQAAAVAGKENLEPADVANALSPPQLFHLIKSQLLALGTVREDAKTVARIEGGRWIADCPFCPSAQVVSPTDPRFLCAGYDGCSNIDIGGAYATIVFPADEVLARIEGLLVKRPKLTNRNWLSGETTHDLGVENVKHGIR